MVTSFTPRAGISGTAKINGNELPLVSWRVGAPATIVEFRNSLTGHYPRRLSTYLDSRFECMVDWDDANNIFGAPFAIKAGDTITNVHLNIDGTGGTLYWNYPSAIVQDTPQDTEVVNKINTRLVCLTDGPFAPPGQTVPSA